MECFEDWETLKNPLGGKINDTKTAAFGYVIPHSSKAWIPIIWNLRKSLKIQKLRFIYFSKVKKGNIRMNFYNAEQKYFSFHEITVSP